MSITTRPVEIRLATAAEKCILEGIQRRASLIWDEYRADLIAHPEVIVVPSDQIEGGRVMVAMLAGAPAGFVALDWREDGMAELDGLFVEPDLHRQGIGAQLVAAAAQCARQRGCRQMHVVANPRVLAFYRRCGFHKVGDAETQFGPAPAMIKDLA